LEFGFEYFRLFEREYCAYLSLDRIVDRPEVGHEFLKHRIGARTAAFEYLRYLGSLLLR